MTHEGEITVAGAAESYIEFKVRVWYDPAADVIHIAGPEGLGVDSVVSDHPASLSVHPDLFQKLKAVLVRHACFHGTR